ncbi:DUF169 domain-containing protein [Clostridiales bacterium F-3ap]|uniref:DUF169 domain-containing protein n=2 Tax=Anaerotalea alkaliphila TaxID=2662126 RepID=A0A7X5KP70_9FIRM|nr:DUF169 domain-containing protein [Anaerotalea alkaliphila]
MDRKELEGYFRSYLQLDRNVVGVKLYQSKEEFCRLDIKQNKHKNYYCHMVNKASNGKMRKGDLSNFACETSGKLLGLDAFYEEKEGIDGWYDSGLYANRRNARIEHESVVPVKGHNTGVVVGPLKNLPQDPDVVILVCNPYQAMRVVQGYTYHYGFKSDIKMSGMCGVCFESTVVPVNNQEFSVSLLCSGTRFVCKWPDDVLMVSFPFGMAGRIIDGIISTAQACEPNHKKTEIKHRLHHDHLKEKTHLHHNEGYFYRK